VLIIKGEAVLTPTDGSPPVRIYAGDHVTFHRGLKLEWEIIHEMSKHYCNFDEDGKEMKIANNVNCDVCGVDCWAESYFLPTSEEDICPACYAKPSGRAKYSDAEHQKEGCAIESGASGDAIAADKAEEEHPSKKARTTAE
jgi:hypothetical protein